MTQRPHDHARRNPQEEQNRRIETRKEIEAMKKKIEPEPPKERRTLQTCFVCGKKITGDSVYIGQDKHRHKRCKPGGARWMESEQAKKSEITTFFLEPETEKKREEADDG
jgi:hypothetical protein